MKSPILFNGNNRGSSEVIFIGLFTLFVASAGIGGMALVNDITDSSEDQVNQPSFELESGNQNKITYEGNNPISEKNTEKIIIKQEKYNNEYVLYNGSGADDRNDAGDFNGINPNEEVINTTHIRNSGELKPGATATVYWHSQDGVEQVVSEFYLPAEATTGTAVLSNGSVKVEEDADVDMGFNAPSDHSET